jgi:hypothetical protein
MTCRFGVQAGLVPNRIAKFWGSEASPGPHFDSLVHQKAADGPCLRSAPRRVSAYNANSFLACATARRQARTSSGVL